MKAKSIALLVAGAAPIYFLAGCKSREESAKQGLQERGYELTPAAFFRAAESDDVDVLERLVANGIAPDTRNAAGDTALHAAAVSGMRRAVTFLLDRKVPVDIVGAEGRTPLMATVMQGTPDMVRYLLSQKADPHLRDAHGYKPLMLAVFGGRGDMIGELAPYDREKLDDALLIASLEGKASVIDALTSHGASIYARMDDGRTPLMLAAENGNLDAVDVLLELGANRFSMDEEGRIASDMAREAGHEELALRLAEPPQRDEFALEDPEEAAFDLLAASSELTPAGSADGGGREPSSPPWNQPVAGEGAFGELPARRRAPVSLEGAVLDVPRTTTSSAAVSSSSSPAPLVMRAFRHRELPVRVESVEGRTATLRIPGQGVKQVEQGATIPGSDLVVVRVQRRMQETKDGGGLAEVSVVEVEESGTGLRRELISGLASTAHDPVALVEDGAGTQFVARAGHTFRGADGEEYRVTDVRSNQMVIENRGSGEVITVPLRGPRG